jgi:hypothetical protein
VFATKRGQYICYEGFATITAAFTALILIGHPVALCLMPCEFGRSGDNIGKQTVFQLDDLIFEVQLLLL